MLRIYLKLPLMKSLLLTLLFAVQAGAVLAAGVAPVIEQGDGPLEVQLDASGGVAGWVAPTLSAFDVEGDVLTWGVVSGVTPTGVSPGRRATRHGVLEVAGSGTSPDHFIYRPRNDNFERDSFRVGVSDGSRFDWIDIEVTPGSYGGAEATGTAAPVPGDHGRDKSERPTAGSRPLGRDYTLTIIVTGSGAVRTNMEGFVCQGACGQGFPAGYKALLTAHHEADYRFAGWGGACQGTDECLLPMEQDVHVDARFLPAQ